MKIKIRKKPLTRKHLANPINMSFKKRLKKSKSINLKNNVKFIDMGNGYFKTEPKDKTKSFD